MALRNLDVVSRLRRQERLIRFAPYILVGVVFLVLVPLSRGYIQGLVTEMLIYGIFALSLNLLMGYAGLFSLGHAAYFGAAAYTTGNLMVRCGIDSFWVLAPAGMLMGLVLSVVFGIIALRPKGLYFMFVTIGLSQLLGSLAEKWRSVTGGSNGFVGIHHPTLGLSGSTLDVTSFYFLVLVCLVISQFLSNRLINSPFGQALQGIRDDEVRMEHLGYNVWLYRYIAFIIAGTFAGLAGTLFACYSGIVVPMHINVHTSALITLMLIIGSDRVTFGPIVGAILVILLQYVTSIFTPERWPIILGSIYVIAIMFFRGGITIHVINLWKRLLYTAP